jgi:hypothetical protein
MSAVGGIIRDVLSDTELTDPADIAAEAFARIDADKCGEYLMEIMRGVVVVEMSRIRTATVHPAPSARSAFVSAVRDYSNALRARVVVDGAWKMYGDCTVTDLDVLAAASRRKAAEHVGAAERHEKVRAAVEEYNVETVKDLPEPVIAQTLGGAR